MRAQATENFLRREADTHMTLGEQVVSSQSRSSRSCLLHVLMFAGDRFPHSNEGAQRHRTPCADHLSGCCPQRRLVALLLWAHLDMPSLTLRGPRPRNM